MKKIGKAIWAFTYVLGTVLATVVVFPIILVVAIIHTIGKTFEGKEE